MQVLTGTVAIKIGTPRVSIRGSTGATVEERLKVLEGNLERMEAELSKLQNHVDEELERRDLAIEDERQARGRADHEIQNKLTATETGGLHISAMGAWWLVAGVILGTIPDKLAAWFG